MYIKKNKKPFIYYKLFSCNIYLSVPKFIIGIINYSSYLLILIEAVHIPEFFKFLQKHTQFNYLIDVYCVDKVTVTERFFCQYLMRQLLNNKSSYAANNTVLQLNVRVVLADFGKCVSVSENFVAAVYAEREIWDMFGVYFNNHKDLRRLLNDYGFIGYPLRRDFPLSGYVEVRYDDSNQRIITEPVELTQEYRNFDFLNPWSFN